MGRETSHQCGNDSRLTGNLLQERDDGVLICNDRVLIGNDDMLILDHLVLLLKDLHHIVACDPIRIRDHSLILGKDLLIATDHLMRLTHHRKALRNDLEWIGGR